MCQLSDVNIKLQRQAFTGMFAAIVNLKELSSRVIALMKATNYRNE